ncbi:MAG: LptF/LptG family permease [Bacteroidales bacterium]|nr:LptF/LptG family permease [Bacteroidales bacterium]
MTKRIYRLVLKSYLGPLVFTFFIALFILLMQFLWKYVDDLVGKGLEWYIIAELLFYASSTFVPLALPLAILLSSLMTFGNLGEHYELVAMKSSGISLWKIMMPLIVLSVAISVFAFYFSNNVLPVANLKFKALLYDVREQKLALDIKEGIFYNGIDGYVIRIGKKEKDGKRVRDVMIYDHSEKKGNVSLTLADSGRMELTPDSRYLIFDLYQGSHYLERTDARNYRVARPFQRSTFGKQSKVFSLVEFELTRTNEDLFRNNYQMLNLRQLGHAEDSLIRQFNERKSETVRNNLKHFFYFSRLDSAGFSSVSLSGRPSGDMLASLNSEQKREALDYAVNKARQIRDQVIFNRNDEEIRRKLIYKHQVEWHRKFTLSFACFVLFFIGAPLGAIIRKGGLGLPVVVSVLLFVIFHIISMTGEKSVRSGVLDANIGMWLAPAVLLPIGIFLTFKATSDSPLLDAEAWMKFLRSARSCVHPDRWRNKKNEIR